MTNSAGFYKTEDISCNECLFVNFLYGTGIGGILLKLLTRQSVSKFLGLLASSAVSRIFIKSFIKQNNTDMSEYENEQYKSFNGFFTRQIKNGFRSFSLSDYDVISPSDGRLTAYPIAQDGVFSIKNSEYTIRELLQDNALAEEFIGGVCLIFRLTTNDYHRYAYIDAGKSLSRKRIKGVLHTVRPISQKRFKVFVQNTREYEVMHTQNFGKVIQMEVGALFVGRIINYELRQIFKRGEEKGMFEFGGSTIVMMFKKNTVSIDEMIYENTRLNKETIVKMGSKIGEKHKLQKQMKQ